MGREREPSNYILHPTGEALMKVIQHRATRLLLGYIRPPRHGLPQYRAFHANEYGERGGVTSWVSLAHTQEGCCDDLAIGVKHRRDAQKHLVLKNQTWRSDHTHYVIAQLTKEPQHLEHVVAACPPKAFELRQTMLRPRGGLLTFVADLVWSLRDAGVVLEVADGLEWTPPGYLRPVKPRRGICYTARLA